jgi:catechol 2,3-dioxygenase-like lactoylglutathione lyase family enzyme
MKSWSNVCVSVADLDEVLKLWAGIFGLEIVAQKDGSDEDLARLWGLDPADVSRQALLATPGQETGTIHFVEFDHPGPAFRENAQKFDLCPKNLDIYVSDMPARIEELKSAGYTFQKENFNEITAPDGIVFREIHMIGHDAINIVLMEIIGLPLPFSQKGYAAIGPVVTTVADAISERSFYRDIFGLELLNDNLLEGPMIERAFGLPPGTSMDMSIWGSKDNWFGRMQIVDYRGVDGSDIFPNSVPKQRGILQVSYATQDLAELIQRLDQAGIAWTDSGRLSTLPAQGRFIRFKSPAGFHVDVFE